ncbi:hypothetical protein HYDPIDRAFT_117172 [Hydnomerulius pinastri MD-312]|uniref:Uncharacterized protein n=1 Tax=Hydnomerulius pinastri MD-312 TaxID=994086 RepID=A0A0C9WAY6_9AGAM|nr:hypothetical protein HYDPIDRAFT_117172 [Hydnomerulius pinastri MD-312]
MDPLPVAFRSAHAGMQASSEISLASLLGLSVAAVVGLSGRSDRNSMTIGRS